MTDLILGVDPGIRGALAFYSPRTRALVVHDLPLVYDPGRKPVLDLGILTLIVDAYARETRFAVIEAPGARPDQGLSSTYRFAEAVGQMTGVVAGCYIPVKFAVPAVWKTLLGLSRDKSRSRRMASDLFPRQEHLFRRVKDADRAEAVLLAIFGAERLARC